jgi:hypothetical protein
LKKKRTHDKLVNIIGKFTKNLPLGQGGLVTNSDDESSSLFIDPAAIDPLYRQSLINKSGKGGIKKESSKLTVAEDEMSSYSVYGRS